MRERSELEAKGASISKEIGGLGGAVIGGDDTTNKRFVLGHEDMNIKLRKLSKIQNMMKCNGYNRYK